MLDKCGSRVQCSNKTVLYNVFEPAKGYLVKRQSTLNSGRGLRLSRAAYVAKKSLRFQRNNESAFLVWVIGCCSYLPGYFLNQGAQWKPTQRIPRPLKPIRNDDSNFIHITPKGWALPCYTGALVKKLTQWYMNEVTCDGETLLSCFPVAIPTEKIGQPSWCVTFGKIFSMILCRPQHTPHHNLDRWLFI